MVDSERGGLAFGLGGSNRRVEGLSYRFGATPIFPESDLELLQLIMEAFLVTQSPGCVHQG
jgi:hypothetical protein